MSVYIEQGFTSKNMFVSKYGLEECLLRAGASPAVNITEENCDRIKATQGCYAISGEMVKLEHGTDNIISRDALALDLDDVSPQIADFDDLENEIRGLFNVAWYLYPTAKNGLKGTRGRLIIPLDTPANKEQYEALAYGLTSYLIDQGALTRADKSSFRFGQLFGLPIKNQFTKGSLVRINRGKLFPTESYTAFKEPEKPSRAGDYSTRSGGQSYGASLLDRVFNGIPEGERNNSMFELACYFVKIGVQNQTGLLDYLRLINSNYFSPPLGDDELNHVFESARKRVLN
ncbi:primase alpha helix C-terminal domain-containing protein [Lactobacillus delbrueckii]|uniref:primase alpha helix C-terminal domain-containing protein n=1 Tax=Lactobacillus delbrueckii TaxID=1584 RepID=UPI001E3618EC|nr:primase alpha helix C-terminal domain-containing protein [Lactobacillus delbrueckii]MCD5433850.1 primase alpha helix C-terminal domain-containing protein [Lactobacillus delbrueckii subsp. lactis]MCD5439546.1 primase alpha helix C-terminal domain-containing protein [Lactobacillus delbrueckii subsp. lactis]